MGPNCDRISGARPNVSGRQPALVLLFNILQYMNMHLSHIVPYCDAGYILKLKLDFFIVCVLLLVFALVYINKMQNILWVYSDGDEVQDSCNL